MKGFIKNKEFCIGAGFFLLGLVYFVLAFLIPSYNAYGGSSVVDSSFVPKVTGVLLIGLSALHMFLHRKPQQILPSPTTAPPDSDKEGEFKVEDYDDDAVSRNADTKALIGIFVILVLYIALMPLLGFMISTALFLSGSILLLTPAEKRNLLLLLVISVGVAVGVYYLFVKGLGLVLPAGILG